MKINTHSSPSATQHLPVGVKVIGRWNEQIIIQFGLGSETERNWLFLNISDLILKPERLACEMAKRGHIQFARGKKLRDVADAILHQASASTTLCMPKDLSGSITIEDGGVQYSAYAWQNSLYFFGDQPDCKIRAEKKPLGLDSATLDAWKQQVGVLCENNPNLIFVICHALSAPLRVEHKRPFVIIQFIGPSSVGKTTTQKVVTSMWVSPLAEGAIPQLNGTLIGIYERLSQYAGQPACFQDTRQFAAASELEKLLYSVADASSRFKHGKSSKPLTCTLILSNERSILDMAAKDKDNLDEGVFARYLEIHAEAEHGMFHDIHEADNAAEFAREIESRAEQYSSAVWPEWIASLSKKWNEVDRKYARDFKLEQDNLLNDLDGNKLAAVDQRLIREFAYSLWTGVLAVKMGILPFTQGDIRITFQHVLKSYLLRRSSGATPLAERAIEVVRGYIDQNPARFPRLESYGSSEIKMGCAGYRHKTQDGQELFLFFPQVFRKAFIVLFGNVVFDFLLKADLLMVNGSVGNQYQVRLPNTNNMRKRFIAIKAKICFDAN